MAEYVTEANQTFKPGFKETWTNTIKDISPMTTPALTLFGNEVVDSIDYEVYAEDLEERDGSIDNARHSDVDVADIASKDEDTIPMNNYTQIHFEYVTATESQEGSFQVGIDKKLDHKGMRLLKHLKQNYETRVLTGVAKRKRGEATLTGYHAGAPGLIGNYADVCNSGTNYGTDSDNVITALQSFGDATPGDIGGESFTDSQGVLDRVLEDRWDDGGDPDTMFVKAKDMRSLSGILDNEGSTRYYESMEKVVNRVEIYKSPLGEIKIIPTHAYKEFDNLATSAYDTATGGGTQITDFALLLNPIRWKTITHKTGQWRSENVPRTGLQFKRWYSAEVGLRSYNAGGDAVFDFAGNDGWSEQAGLSTTAADYSN